jgi:hypothetical protein
MQKTKWGKFEDIRDREVIEDCEKKLSTEKIKFESADDLKKNKKASGRHKDLADVEQLNDDCKQDQK